MASITLKRMIRGHYLVPIILIALAVAAFFSAKPLSSTGASYLVIQSASFSLALITHLFLTFGAMWLAVSIIPHELSSGNMRMNVTKPVSTFSIILGHFTGMFLYLCAGALIMSVVLTFFTIIKGANPGFLFIGYILHLLPLYGCLLGLGIVLSLVANRPLAFFFLLLLAGEEKWNDWAQLAAVSSEPFYVKMPLESISTLAFWISPPISRLELNIAQYMGFDFPVGKYLLVLLYCASYLSIAILLASLILDKREI